MPLHPTPYRRPPGRSIVEPYDFGVDPDALMDEDVWNAVVAALSQLDGEKLHAVRLIAAAPTSARLRIVDEIDEAKQLQAMKRPMQRAG